MILDLKKISLDQNKGECRNYIMHAIELAT